MCAGYRSLAFIASRRGTETLAATVREQVGMVDESLTGKVAAYRGGYLAGRALGAGGYVDTVGSAPRSRRIDAAYTTAPRFAVRVRKAKVPQRIAVRLRIDAGQPLAARLRPGMSVIVRVDTRSEAMD